MSTITIPTTLAGAHPTIRRTDELCKSFRTRDGWFHTKHERDVIHLRVRKPNLRRVLLLYHAIAVEAQRRGHPVRVKSGGCAGGFAVEIDRHLFEVTVHETQQRTPHVDTAADRKDRARGHTMWIPQWDYTPTDRLQLRIGHGGYESPLATDGVKVRVESCLVRVFDKLEAKAQEATEREAYWANERAEQRAREIAAEERRLQAERDAARADHFRDLLDDWRTAREGRDFIAAMRQRSDLTTQDEEWLRWAAGHLRAIDPAAKALALSRTSTFPDRRSLNGYRAHQCGCDVAHAPEAKDGPPDGGPSPPQ